MTHEHPAFESLEARRLLSAAIENAIPPLTPEQLDQRLSENLGRGVHAQYNGSSVHVSWRWLYNDSPSTGFNVYRRVAGGPVVKLNDAPITATTDFVDTTVPANSDVYYSVTTVIGGLEVATSPEAHVNTTVAKNYKSIPITSTAGKIGIGDLDGDGEYDFVVRTPMGSIDPGYWHNGGWGTGSYSSYKLRAYKSDGTPLWMYDLGPNIEGGIWWSPFVVYDVDGDGKAEVLTKAVIDPGIYRDETGKVVSGPEHLAVLDGATGQVVDYIDWPSREGYDSHNHASRNLIGIAHLDGTKTASIIVVRGTYDEMRVHAYDFVNGQLSLRWHWESWNETLPGEWDGQGGHSLHTFDVDGDGRDEIFLGQAMLDEYGKGVWTTGKDDVDHIYIGDLIPERPGFEIYSALESARNKPGDRVGISMRDAATGELIWAVDEDTVHIHDEGMVADIDPRYPGAEGWSGEKDLPKRWLHSPTGEQLDKSTFWDNRLQYGAVYWDADPQREIIVAGDIVDYGLEPISLFLTEDFNSTSGWSLQSSDNRATRTSSNGTIEIRQPTNGTWTYTSNVIPIEAGKQYFFRPRLSTKAGAPVAIRVAALDSSGNVISANILENESLQAPASHELHTFGSMMTTPVGTASIRITFAGARTDGVVLDQIMIFDDPNPGRYKTSISTQSQIGWADVFGDWREEIIVSLPGEIRIYSTDIPAVDRRVTLMQDPLYRSDVAHQAMGYHQIPTSSYWLGQTTTQQPDPDDPPPTTQDIYLSDLTPESVISPYYGLKRDASTMGGPLTIGGQTFAKGIGVHSTSEVIYRLDGAYSRLTSWVGINDSVGNSPIDGTAVFQVWGDGQLLAQSPRVTGADDPVFMDVDISGVQVLRLVTTTGGDNDYKDHTNWADAKLYVASSPVTPKPTITITATDAHASESGDTATFTLTRTGDLTQVLTVNYSVSGTATNGVDYATLSGSAHFAAGQSELILTVVPIQDELWEGDETVIVTLTPSPQFIIAAASSATVTIADDETPPPQEQVTYLSDLNPVSSTSPYYGVKRDRSLLGSPLTIGGQTFEKGLGVHSPSEIVYNLGGKYALFQSYVGIDDSVGDSAVDGSVRFHVYVDGVLVKSSSRLTGSMGAELLSVDVRGAQTLRLVTDTGGLPQDNDYKDHANWADAKLFSDGSLPPILPSEEQGLTGEYFDDLNLTDLREKRIDPQVDFDFGWESSVPGMSGDTFSVRWSGYVIPPTTGEYILSVLVDDGVRLWIDNQLVLDHWYDQPPTEHSVKLNLTADTPYAIRMEYYERHVTATAKLSWQGPGIAKQIIPAQSLRPLV